MKSIQAQWVLGLIPTDRLPDLATEAISAGIESKSLVELAGLDPAETDEARRLFEDVLNEIGYEGMAKAEALRAYATAISASIVKSEIAPFEGAKKIWQATLHVGLTSFHDLDAFIYAASEWEDRPQDRSMFEKAIIEEAVRWSGTHIERA
jgi:hypothetical protein